MNSGNQEVSVRPMSDEQVPFLVLDHLALYEISAIGKSIVGLPNPELTMFPPHQREDILINAVYHLGSLLKRGHANVQASLAPYVAPLLKGLEGTVQYPHLEREILERFKESIPRITVLLSLGRQDEARKVAANLSDSNSRNHFGKSRACRREDA